MKDIVATIGTYTDKNGDKKYINRTVGKVIETRKGTKIKLDASFNPAGLYRNDDGSVWLSIFEQKRNEIDTSQDDDDEPPF